MYCLICHRCNFEEIQKIQLEFKKKNSKTDEYFWLNCTAHINYLVSLVCYSSNYIYVNMYNKNIDCNS